MICPENSAWVSFQRQFSQRFSKSQLPLNEKSLGVLLCMGYVYVSLDEIVEALILLKGSLFCPFLHSIPAVILR